MQPPEMHFASRKRIDNMQRRADRESGLIGDPEESYDRLPPGQSLVKQGFPVLDLGVHPVLELDAWSLVISIPGQPDFSYDWKGWGTLPTALYTHDIHCVTAWSVFDANFQGVGTRELLKRSPVGDDVTHVLVHGADGYSANLTLTDFLAAGALLATHLNGKPLTVSHGGPLRLVIPHLYFWKSPKWVTRIEFLSGDQPGFWEQRGYHNRGNPWRQERYGPKQATKPIRPETILIKAVLPPPKGWERFKRWYAEHLG